MNVQASPSRTGPPELVCSPEWMETSDGAAIPYWVKGDGPPLVMVHGWSQSGAMFSNQLEALSDEFMVVVPDLRGHGASPNPIHGARIARLGSDLRQLIVHLGLERTSILGWSMGASVIWSYIDLFGAGAIDRLVFVDQPSMLTKLPEMSDEEALDAGALFDPSQMIDMYARLRSAEGRSVRSDFVKGMVTKSIPDDLFEWIIAENDKTDSIFAASLFLSHCTNDWRDVLPRIDRRSLVLAGSVSHVSARSQRYISSKIPNAVYHEFSEGEGGAHFPFLEAADTFNRVLRAFLSAS